MIFLKAIYIVLLFWKLKYRSCSFVAITMESLHWGLKKKLGFLVKFSYFTYMKYMFWKDIIWKGHMTN